jgi:hypothetical protein
VPLVRNAVYKGMWKAEIPDASAFTGSDCVDSLAAG